jgi:tetratricopeptide (TPR) repeat protein
MKRIAVTIAPLFALLFALSFATGLSAAPEKWWDAYARGVAAVNAKNYKVAADALQKAIAEMPNEGTNVRTRKELITYVPHFWLGIAKFNLGDADGALREWRTSEEQGVVARTEYYARMKDWVARAQTSKQRDAQDNAASAKKAADTAISKALEVQLDALSAGGDRADSYLAAQRKLMEARTQFQKAGTDVGAYKSAELTAQQAASLFNTATEEGKKQRAARAAMPPPVRKPVQVPVQTAQVIPPAPAPVKVVETAPLPKTDTAPATPVITQAEVDRRIAEQEARRKQIEAAKKPVVVTATALPPIATAPVAASTIAPTGASRSQRPDLRGAYHAFAAGDLAASEQLLTGILNAQPAAAEAYLLRGCARYTRAILSRDADRLMLAAKDDFRAALDRNSALRLDRKAFSPKLIAFFDQVRRRRD